MTLLHHLWRPLALASLALASTTVAADGLMLYANEVFEGERVNVRDAAADLAALRFSRRTNSLVVESGEWQVCGSTQYRPPCAVFGPGRYDRLPTALRQQIASARPVNVMAGGVPVGLGMAPAVVPGAAGTRPVAAVPPLVLYQDANSGGREFAVSDAIPNLDDFGFNDEASSLSVRRGRWQLCAHADFGGPCQVFGPGRHALRDPLHDGVSSVRRVVGTGDEPLPAAGGAMLFENAGMTGRSLLRTVETRNLRDLGFNDLVTTVEVLGGRWELCANADFAGPCETLGPGTHTLGGALQDKLSSLRPR